MGSLGFDVCFSARACIRPRLELLQHRCRSDLDRSVGVGIVEQSRRRFSNTARNGGRNDDSDHGSGAPKPKQEKGVSWLSGNAAGGPYRLAYRHVVAAQPVATPAPSPASSRCNDSKRESSTAARASINSSSSRSTIISKDNDNVQPAVLFCNGFRSAMSGGTKALALEAHCQRKGWEFCSFDYRGHGLSLSSENDDNFTEFVLTDWIEDASNVLNRVLLPQGNNGGSGDKTRKKVILVGSSMGAWISIHLALRYNNNNNNNKDDDHDHDTDSSTVKNSSADSTTTESEELHAPTTSSGVAPAAIEEMPVSGILGVAAAPDFIQDLYFASSPEQRAEWKNTGVAYFPSRYSSTSGDGDGYPIAWSLIRDAARNWGILPSTSANSSTLNTAPFFAEAATASNDESSVPVRSRLRVRCPVRLLHGKCDEDVSWKKSLELSNLLRRQAAATETNHHCDANNTVGLTLIDGGDHRLSRPQDIQLLLDTLDSMVLES